MSRDSFAFGARRRGAMGRAYVEDKPAVQHQSRTEKAGCRSCCVPSLTRLDNVTYAAYAHRRGNKGSGLLP